MLERRVLEGEIVRKCLARSEKQCSFVEHRNYKARHDGVQCLRFVLSVLSFSRGTSLQVVYRRYASLYVLAGVDADENPLAALELVHSYVEALDKFFGAVCELDIMFHLEKAHYILDEMVMNGACVGTWSMAQRPMPRWVASLPWSSSALRLCCRTQDVSWRPTGPRSCSLSRRWKS